MSPLTHRRIRFTLPKRRHTLLPFHQTLTEVDFAPPLESGSEVRFNELPEDVLALVHCFCDPHSAHNLLLAYGSHAIRWQIVLAGDYHDTNDQVPGLPQMSPQLQWPGKTAIVLCPPVEEKQQQTETLQQSNLSTHNLNLDDSGVHPSSRATRKLRLACQVGDVETVRSLLRSGVDASVCNSEALKTACRHGHVDVVRELLKVPQVRHFASLNSALATASENGRVTVVKELLAVEGIDPAAEDYASIRAACENGHLDVISELLHLTTTTQVQNKGDFANSTANRHQTMYIACESGYLGAVQLLVKLIGVSCMDIRAACGNGHLTILRLILNQLPQFVLSCSDSALKAACAAGRVGVVRELLSATCDDSLRMSEIHSMVARACRNGHPTVVRDLLHLWPLDPETREALDVYIAAHHSPHAAVVLKALRHDEFYTNKETPLWMFDGSYVLSLHHSVLSRAN